jgi:hypothetical protein
LHKGFKCIDVSKGRIYVSQDVIFDESSFPFSSLHSTAGARYTFDILLLPENNDVTNLTNTYTISSLPIFDVLVQIQPDSCALHGTGILPQALPTSAGTCVTSGTPNSLVVASADQVSSLRDVATPPMAPDPTPSAPACS